MSKNARQVARQIAYAPVDARASSSSSSSASASARGHTGEQAADTQRNALIAAAQAVRDRAHAPYSRFTVGAAVLDDQGRIHAGCNVENASYPQGWCAEASALAVMVAAGGKRVLAVAVCAVADEPVTPCGGCRQKLREFAADDCPVWIADLKGQRASHTLGALLPHGFGPVHLSRGEVA